MIVEGSAGPAEQDGAAEAGRRTRLLRALPLVGIAAAAWAVVPPYLGPALNTETRVEIVDQVVPGAFLLVVSLLTWVMTERWRHPPAILPLAGGLAVLLAGLWMLATHIPLVGQALRDEVPVGAAAFHTAPAVAVTVLGAVWAGAGWRAGS